MDDGFRDIFSFVHYRRWGVMELWEGGRISGSWNRGHIEVWHNWERVGVHMSRDAARAQVNFILKSAPASLHDLVDYLRI